MRASVLITPRHRWPTVGLLLGLAAILLTAPPARAADAVTLQLNGPHRFRYAGYYAALHKGYYAAAGLTVTIRTAGEGAFDIDPVVDGRAHYGVAGPELLLERARGAPVVVLAPIFQHSADILLTVKETGITTLQDLIGKRVMLSRDVGNTALLAALQSDGVPLSALKRQAHSHRLSDLLEGRTDAVSGQIISDPWRVERAGFTPVVLAPQTYGVDFYGDCLFTAETEADGHPRRAERFLKASLAGWAYALAHSEEIITVLNTAYAVDVDYRLLRQEADAIRRVMVPELVEVGHTNPGRWQHMARTLVNLGLLDEAFSLDGFLYTPPDAGLVDARQRGWLLGVLLAGLLVSAILVVLFLFNRRLTSEVDERKRAVKALHHSEERFRVLFDFAPMPYQSLDDKGRIIAVNQTWLEMLGYTRDEVLGRSFAEFLHPDWVAHFKANFPRFKSIGEVLGVEFELRAKDGRYIWTSFDGKIRRSERGIFLQTHCVFKDITERRQLERQLAAQEAALRQAQKMESLGTLAGGIAHDFNNILAAMIGFCELAMDDVEPHSAAADNLQEVYTAGIRARELVRQILTFARQADEEKHPVVAGAIVKETLKFLRSSIPATVEIAAEVDSRALVMANPTQLHQIVLNLCTNATQAMEAEGGALTITLTELEVPRSSPQPTDLCDLAPGPYLRLRVADTGPGISSEVIDSIFDPYFTTKAFGEGTGMGLAMVHGIVESSGGKIRVQSEPGEGAVFSVYLPVVREAVAEAQIVEAAEMPTGDEHILIIDDERPIIAMLSRTLTRLGYRVTALQSSREALEQFRRRPYRFDLVMTDTTMPALAGDRLAAELLRIRPDIPIIICTGYSKHISAERAADMGARALVHKPIVRDELARTIRRALDSAIIE